MTTNSPLKLSEIPTLPVLLKTFPGVKAFFFDMDGTLFDTEKYHAEALIQIGIKHKIRPPHSPEALHQLMLGKADHFVYEIAKSWENFPAHWSVEDFVKEKNTLLLELLSQDQNKKYFSESMANLLKEIKQNSFTVALVTSSEKVVTMALLKQAGLDHFFSFILTRDDCPHHKPDPWPYKKAMELASSDQHETLIFEDSSVGLAAALASGAHVIEARWYQGFKI